MHVERDRSLEHGARRVEREARAQGDRVAVRVDVVGRARLRRHRRALVDVPRADRDLDEAPLDGVAVEAPVAARDGDYVLDAEVRDEAVLEPRRDDGGRLGVGRQHDERAEPGGELHLEVRRRDGGGALVRRPVDEDEVDVGGEALHALEARAQDDLLGEEGVGGLGGEVVGERDLEADVAHRALEVRGELEVELRLPSVHGGQVAEPRNLEARADLGVAHRGEVRVHLVAELGAVEVHDVQHAA